MAGLNIYSFDQYAQGDSIADILEIRLADSIAINIRAWADANKTVPQDLSAFAFAVSYVDALATFGGSQTTLASISDITVLDAVPKTDPNLVVSLTAVTGGAVLSIPSTVTGLPVLNAPIGLDRTLFKIIQIKTTFAATNKPTFNNILRPTIGVIVRYAF